MKPFLRLFACAVVPGFLAIAASAAWAQAPLGGAAARAPLNSGFQVRLDAESTNEEILRQEQLYAMEVTFKPMRMRWVHVTDPRTGVKKREVIWYLVYKAVNRPLDRRADDSNTRPQNVEDPVPPMVFVPEFTLVATDGGRRVPYRDAVIPEAFADIRSRESKPHRKLVLKHSVDIVGPVPPITPETSKTENAIYGVAMWRGVDPDTDFFTVYMSGFSNAHYKAGGVIYRKTIVQKYRRPGDRFFLTETEIDRDGDPTWAYWPEDFTPGKAPAAKSPPTPPAKKAAP